MKVKTITKRYYSEILKLSFKNWKTYKEFIEDRPKKSYEKKGYTIVKLSEKNTNLLQNLFFNVKRNFAIQNFHFDKIKKHHSFNRLKFNTNKKAKKMQSMVTDYLTPREKTKKILQPIISEVIKKTENILNSEVIVNKIMIERNKPNNLKKLKKILKKNKFINNQTKNVYLNAFGFHKDNIPKAFKKILIYPFEASMTSGTTILKGFDKKIKPVEFKNGSRALIFDNTDVTHKGVLSDKLRYIIQITFYLKSKKIKFKQNNYPLEKITNSNFPLLPPSKIADVIDKRNLYIKKLYSKIEKDLIRK